MMAPWNEVRTCVRARRVSDGYGSWGSVVVKIEDW